MASVVLGRIAEHDGYPQAFLLAGLVTTGGVLLLVANTNFAATHFRVGGQRRVPPFSPHVRTDRRD